MPTHFAVLSTDSRSSISQWFFIGAPLGMPAISISGDGRTLLISLSILEKIFSLTSNKAIPLSSITSVSVAQRPWAERPWRGIRVGTGCPYVILLGRTVTFSSQDFVSVRGRGPALVLELAAGNRWGRIVISSAEADQLAEMVDKARSKLPNDASSSSS